MIARATHLFSLHLLTPPQTQPQKRVINKSIQSRFNTFVVIPSIVYRMWMGQKTLIMARENTSDPRDRESIHDPSTGGQYRLML